jgi:translation elongation factor P/translation initiation factor 5A
VYEDDDELRTFDIDDANWIIQNNDGKVCILVDEEAYDQDETIFTITEDQEVILKYFFLEDFNDEDEDEYLTD